MNLGLGLGSAAILDSGGGAPPPNPNLFLWTEAIDNAVWTKTNCVVFSEAEGSADEIASTAASAVIAQVTTTAALVGADATSTKSIGPSLVRYEMTGTFDGLPYTLSAKLKDTGNASVPEVVFRISRSGGFLRGSFEDPVGDGDYIITEVQLEQAASASAYVYREGT
jgi:hypothetical protein